MNIREFTLADSDAVVALWQQAGLLKPWNDAHKDIARKLQVQPELFLLATDASGQITGSLMAGYEGHRGWLNYLAVADAARGTGVGRVLVDEAKARLLALGCCKINLQIRDDNLQAQGFYRALGFSEDPVVSMGLRLEDD